MAGVPLDSPVLSDVLLDQVASLPTKPSTVPCPHFGQSTTKPGEDVAV